MPFAWAQGRVVPDGYAWPLIRSPTAMPEPDPAEYAAARLAAGGPDIPIDGRAVDTLRELSHDLFMSSFDVV